MSNLTAVKLLKPYGVYNKGEVAGFLPETVAKMIEAGVAKPYDAAVAEVEKVNEAEGLVVRLADLERREAELSLREAALLGAGAADSGEVSDTISAKKADASVGAPPKQGAKV